MHWINPMIGGSIPPPIYSASSYYYQIDTKDEILILGGVKQNYDFLENSAFQILENDTTQ